MSKGHFTPPPKGRPLRPTPSTQSFAQKVIDAQRNRLKLPEPDRPLDDKGDEYIPTIPRDITKISDIQLGQLKGEFARFSSWLSWELAKSEVDAFSSVEELTTEEAKVHLKATGTAKERGDLARTHEDVRTLRDSHLWHKAQLKFLKIRYNSCERADKVLSREQTRRADERGRKPDG